MKSAIPIIAFLLLSMFSVCYKIPTDKAQDPMFLQLDGNTPVGIVYDQERECTWVALRMSFKIARIDVSTLETTYYDLPDDYDPEGRLLHGSEPTTLALDPLGNVWITVGSWYYTQGQPYYPTAFMLNITSGQIQVYKYSHEYGNGMVDVKCSPTTGNIWYLANGWLLEIDSEGTLLNGYYVKSATGAYGYMAIDGNNIWINYFSDCEVVMFNTVLGTLDIELTGFTSPLGICVDSDFVYAAEHGTQVGTMGTIARINKTDLSVDRLEADLISVPGGGPVGVFEDSLGYLWFSDNSHYVGRVGGEMYYTESNWNWFMTEIIVPNEMNRSIPDGGELPIDHQMWFACVGSAYVAMKDTSIGVADYDHNGKINILDVLHIARNFGKDVPPAPADADITGPDGIPDGKVNILDVLVVARWFGQTL